MAAGWLVIIYVIQLLSRSLGVDQPHECREGIVKYRFRCAANLPKLRVTRGAVEAKFATAEYSALHDEFRFAPPTDVC